MSSRPRRASVGRGDVAGVRAAAHEVGRARPGSPARARAPRARPPAWSGTPRSRRLLGGLLDVGRGGVVVARQRRRRACGTAGDRRAGGARRSGLVVVAAGDQLVHLRVAQPVLALVVLRGTSSRLTNWRWPGVWSISETSRTSGSPAKGSNSLQERALPTPRSAGAGSARRAAAPAPAPPGIACGRAVGVSRPRAGVAVAHGQAVEHGRDAGRDELRIVRQHRRASPASARRAGDRRAARARRCAARPGPGSGSRPRQSDRAGRAAPAARSSAMRPLGDAACRATPRRGVTIQRFGEHADLAHAALRVAESTVRVATALAHLGVVEHADDRRAARARLADQLGDHGAAAPRPARRSARRARASGARR